MTSTRTLYWAAASLTICWALGASTGESAPTEIAVHIIEAFNPLRTLTMIGPYLPVYEVDGFHLMMSFKAFEFNKANAANQTMACYFLDSEPDTWAPVKPTTETAKRHTDEPAFCVSSSVPENETTFAVAMITRVTNASRKPLTGVLVHAVQGRGQKLLDEAKARGWRDVPLVTFRVTKLQRWRVAPMLTLVQHIQVTRADSKEQAAAQCPPDTHFLTDRRIDGGDYNAGVAGHQVWMLCVTYVKRSLHDLDPAESFYSTTRFRDRSIWRANTCGLHDHSVHFVANGGWPIFRPRKGVQRLLCHDPQRLVKDLDSTKRLESTRQLVRSVHFDESFENRNERLRVDYHGNDAFAFPLQDIDMDAFHKF